MKTTAAPISAVAAALVLLTALAAPPAHTQNIGGILKKGKDALKNKTTDKDDGKDDKADGKAVATTSFALEKQLTEALYKGAPKGAKLLVVQCKSTTVMSKPIMVFLSACVVNSGGKMQATLSPTIPSDAKTKFAQLAEVMRQEHKNQLWQVCKVTVPVGVKETLGDVVAGKFQYGYKYQKEKGGDLAAYDAANTMPTAEQLLSEVKP